MVARVGNLKNRLHVCSAHFKWRFGHTTAEQLIPLPQQPSVMSIFQAFVEAVPVLLASLRKLSEKARGLDYELIPRIKVLDRAR